MFARRRKADSTRFPPKGAFPPKIQDDDIVEPSTDSTQPSANDDDDDEERDTLQEIHQDEHHHHHQEEEMEITIGETMTVPSHPIATTLPRQEQQAFLAATEEEEETPEKEVFQVGDHVYQWCSLLGIPGVFQHHGIVIHVENTIPSSRDNDDAEVEQCLTIADFSNLLPESNNQAANTNGMLDQQATSAEGEDDENYQLYTEDEIDFSVVPQQQQQSQIVPPGTAVGSLTAHQNSNPLAAGSLFQSSADSGACTKMFEQGCLRVYTTHVSKKTKHRWYKVQYGANWFQTHVWKRSGTCTHVESDPPELVLQRVNFLLNSKAKKDELLLPRYHAIFANCECVAVWCKTGTWSTLQAASFLSHTALGQVKGTATIAGVAAAQQVTVPAAGIWGTWFGATTTVPLISVQPWIVPAVAAYGAVSVGGPAVVLAVAKRKWRRTSERLNEALQSHSLEVNLVA